MEQISGSHRADALECSALRNDFQTIKNCPASRSMDAGQFLYMDGLSLIRI